MRTERQRLSVIYGMTLATATTAYLMGYLAAIPTGPIQIEVLKKSLQGHLKTGFLIIATTVAVDVTYGYVALFGIAPFLTKHAVTTLFWLTGGVTLILIGAITATKDHTNARPQGKSAALTALILSATNPVMMLWWLGATRILTDMNLVGTLNATSATTIIMAGTAGMTTYLSILAVFVYKMKKFIGPTATQRIHVVLGYALVCIGLYFITTSLIRT